MLQKIYWNFNIFSQFHKQSCFKKCLGISENISCFIKIDISEIVQFFEKCSRFKQTVMFFQKCSFFSKFGLQKYFNFLEKMLKYKKKPAFLYCLKISRNVFKFVFSKISTLLFVVITFHALNFCNSFVVEWLACCRRCSFS